MACPACHISPQLGAFASLSIAETGRAIELIPVHHEQQQQRHKSRRSEVRSFSRASRRRLLWQLANIDQTAFEKCLFLTLTYPAEESMATAHKSHLDSLLKRLHRAHPDVAALWKLEYTKRNTPHYHILLFGLAFLHHQDLAKSWSAVVKSSNPNHERAGTSIERPRSAEMMSRYITKYFSKSAPLPPNHRGRIWGKSGSFIHALSQQKIFVITKATYVQIRRTFDKLRLSQARTKKFRRASNTQHRQRWFLRSSAIITYLHLIGCVPIFPTHPPPEMLSY